MIAIEQYFHVVLFIMPYMVIVGFILWMDPLSNFGVFKLTLRV